VSANRQFAGADFGLFPTGKTPVILMGETPMLLALDSQLLEERHHRAPVGEGGLQEVQADEGGEQEPVGRMIVREQNAHDHEETRNSSQISFNHPILPPNIKLPGLFAGVFLQV
jgi:hypothetical protein